MKKACRFSVFILIFALLFQVFLNTFSLHFEGRMDAFHKMEKNTADVMVFGSSHVYRNVDPTVFFEEYGISAYDLSSPGQLMNNTYYYMREALKTQHPKIIVLEAYKTAFGRTYSSRPGDTLKAVAGMHSFRDKWAAITTSVKEPDERLNYLFDFSFYHSRYKEITVHDIRFFKPEVNDDYLGFTPLLRSVESKKLNHGFASEKRKPLSDKTVTYLDKIVKLADENDCELIIYLSPYFTKYKKRLKYYNSLEDYAKERGIPYINMNLHLDEIGFDETQDVGALAHLSAKGAYKSTKYLAAYIAEHYDLEDHRGDARFAKYEESSKAMYALRDSIDSMDLPEEGSDEEEEDVFE